MKLSYYDPLFFHLFPCDFLACQAPLESDQHLMYPETKRKKYQTQSSQIMGVWLINHTASLSDMETTATERQSLPMPDFPIYPRSSTTLSNLFVPFCTQTEPVNKGIQNLTCPSIQTQHVARLVRACTAIQAQQQLCDK